MRFTTNMGNYYLVLLDWGKRHEFEEQHKEEYAVHKLGMLEDIEEELGIELIKVCLFALKGGYYKAESSLATPTHISPTDIDVDFFFKYFNCYDSCISLYFKDYGKTWALTKEELE